jgi:hypothetical protein
MENNYFYNISNESNFNQSKEIIFEEIFEVSWFITVIFILLFGSLSIIAVCGNSLISCIVIKNKRMRSSTNYFICNISVADIIIGLLAIPFQVCFYF